MFQRKKIFSGFFFRIVFSLCMAVILFLYSSFIADAAISSDGDLNLAFKMESPKIYLNFFNNFTSDGSDRESPIPYIFRGSTHSSFQLSRPSGSSYSYVTGSVVKRVVCNIGSQTTGLTLSVMPNVYICNTSLPDGVTAYISAIGGNAQHFYFDVSFTLDNVDLRRSRRGGISFSFELSGYADASSFGSSYSYIFYDAQPALDWYGTVNYATDYFDFNSVAGSFYNLLRTQNQSLFDINQNLINRTYIINSSITSQTAADRVNTEWLAQQIYADFALQNGKLKEFSQNEIDNANANHRDLLDNLLSIETRVTNRLNVNSTNEINTANKNADDIMNSYDSTSQGSDNERFDDSQKELQETEDNLFGSATGFFDAVDFTSAASSLVTIASSLSFVSGLMQQLYIKSGVFGMIVTISLVVMIASKIIGLYRFSTGGDGKGG